MKSEYDFSNATVGKFHRDDASTRIDSPTRKFDELSALLKQLFRLDQPELDFGFYRIMNAKSAEITNYLEHDLLPQVHDALSLYKSADKAVLEGQLADALRSAKALGVNPDDSTTVTDLRARLNHTAHVTALDDEVYNYLYGFFRRYYSKGDFISKRLYKPGVYAIPYEGEEVKLHWANSDQYYIKTAEYLRNYAFRLQPANNADPMRVRFRLADAVEGQHSNVREAADKRRVFLLRDKGFLSEEQGQHGKELVVSFEYRPPALSDWPEHQRAHRRTPPSQSDLLNIAEDRLLKECSPRLPRWQSALAAPHITANGDKSCLRVHLNHYTARNTFDYFIHKDLGSFLRRELDFYIKTEVMHLDDLEHESVPGVEQYLDKIRVFRRVALKVIDFLAQLEDFQKKVWLKKKFVTESSYLVRVGYIPEHFWPTIKANDAQLAEWTNLLAADPEVGDLDIQSSINSPEFPSIHPTLLVDTRHFPSDFTAQLLEALGDIDEQTDGVLLHSENFQALSVMQMRYRKRIECIYIDPPYNSATTTIAYKNAYRHSSWLSLMHNRLRLSRNLAAADGSHIVAIDENEQERLGLLLGMVFPDHAKICTSVVHNKKGIQGAYFSYCHEYAFFCIPPALSKTNGIAIPREEWQFTNLRKWGRESERSTARNCFYPILVQNGNIIGFGEVCPDDFHPTAANVIKDDCTLVYPIDQQGIERKWRYARESVVDILDLLRARVIRRSGEIQIEKARSEKTVKTAWDDSRYIAGDYGTRWLTDLDLKLEEDLYPKSVFTVMDSIRTVSGKHSNVLDYFAGSGTTGHAVINLNREDLGRRRFVLVEMGDYFDTVLVPRIKKITFAPEWRNGAVRRRPSSEEVTGSPRIVKIVRLESFEDTLNNLVEFSEEQQVAPDLFSREGSQGALEQYVLNYMLDVETRGNTSLLNVSTFCDPTSYRLKVKQPGTNENQLVVVDLLETFNWLLGLAVRRINAPRSYRAKMERNREGRIRLLGGLREQTDGPWWFRTVTGVLPDSRRALVIWRKRPGGESPDGIERDNLVLDEWFCLHVLVDGGEGHDVIFVNGSNNLENLKSPSDTWTVRLIEDDFHRLMWEE